MTPEELAAVPTSTPQGVLGGGFGGTGGYGAAYGHGTRSAFTVEQLEQTGNARVQRVGDSTINGNARIQRTENTTQQGNARIRRTFTTTRVGNARIRRTEATSQNGAAVIERIESTSQNGNATIERPAYPNGYHYRKKISINPAKVASTGSFVNFPTLYSEIDSNLMLTSNGGKVANNASNLDVRYETLDGTKLSHQNEEYDGSTGKLVSWILVPSMSGTVATDIYLYYGKSLASPEVTTTSLFTSAYRGVWRLNSTPDIDGSTYEHPDSSPSNRPLGSWGPMPTSTSIDAKIGKGLSLNGTSYNLQAASAPLSGTIDFTLQAWYKSTSSGTGYLIQQRDTTGIHGQYELLVYSSGSIGFQHYNGGWQMQVTTSGVNVLDGQWHHITAKRVGATGYIFIDGVQKASGPAGSSRGITPFRFAIGYDFRDSRRYVTGQIDEIRVISGVGLNNDVIVTEYNNQSDPGTFWTIGSEEVPFSVLDTSQTGNARIQRTYSIDQSGNSRIERVESAEQLGSAHIERIETLVQAGNARIQKNNTIEQPGNAFIEKQNTLQQTGEARIARIESITQVGSAQIIRVDRLDQVGDARISRLESLTIVGNAKISNPSPDKRPQQWEDASTEQPAEWQDSDQTQEQQWSDTDNKQPTEWRRQFYD